MKHKTAITKAALAAALLFFLSGCPVDMEELSKPGKNQQSLIPPFETPAGAVWSIEAEDGDFNITAGAAPLLELGINRSGSASGGKYVYQVNKNTGAISFNLPGELAEGGYDVNVVYAAAERDVLHLAVESGGTPVNYYEAYELTGDPRFGFRPGTRVFHTIPLKAGDRITLTGAYKTSNPSLDFIYLSAGSGTASIAGDKKNFVIFPENARVYDITTSTGAGLSASTISQAVALQDSPYLFGAEVVRAQYHGASSNNWNNPTRYIQFNVGDLTAGTYSLYMRGFVSTDSSRSFAVRVEKNGAASFIETSFPGTSGSSTGRGPLDLMIAPSLDLTNTDTLKIFCDYYSNLHTDYMYLLPARPLITVEAESGTLVPNDQYAVNNPGDAGGVAAIANDGGASGGQIVKNIRKSSDGPDDNNNRGFLVLEVPNSVSAGAYKIAFRYRLPYNNSSAKLSLELDRGNTGVFGSPVSTSLLIPGNQVQSFSTDVTRLEFLSGVFDLEPGDLLKIYNTEGWIEIDYLAFLPLE
jgi:hypothetical protein